MPIKTALHFDEDFSLRIEMTENNLISNPILAVQHLAVPGLFSFLMIRL